MQNKNGSTNVTNEIETITVGLIPMKIRAENSLDEFVELVRKCQEEHHTTDEMSIVATVIFTKRVF